VEAVEDLVAGAADGAAGGQLRPGDPGGPAGPGRGDHPQAQAGRGEDVGGRRADEHLRLDVVAAGERAEQPGGVDAGAGEPCRDRGGVDPHPQPRGHASACW
jgi:hypothetical protein